MVRAGGADDGFRCVCWKRLKEIPYAQAVTFEAEARNDSHGVGRDETFVAEFLAGENIADVYFYNRRRYCGYRIANGYRCMRKSAGIQ